MKVKCFRVTKNYKKQTKEVKVKLSTQKLKEG
jgi:hypothetical protein